MQTHLAECYGPDSSVLLERGASSRFCCQRFLLQLSGPRSREWLTNWVTWSPQLLLRSKPVGILSFDGRPVFIRLLRSLAAGQHARTTIQKPDGPLDVPDYAMIQGIFIGCVAAYVIVLALIGPENHGSHFEKGKTAFQAGASREDVSSMPREHEGVHDFERSSVGSIGAQEKVIIQLVETKRRSGDHYM